MSAIRLVYFLDLGARRRSRYARYRFDLFGGGLLQTVDAGGQTGFRPGGRIAMDDVSCTGLVELLARHSVFGFGRFEITRFNGITDLTALRTNGAFYRTVVGFTLNILP